MIELRTGVPGSGKTLSMVQVLACLFKRWESNPDEARPVFVLGIPDLAFPVSEMPLKSVQINKAGSPSLVPDWDAMPDGSLVLIDEAQGVFPPRSSLSTAPEHVSWLNTHRHHGFDIWLTTQHPKLIDVSVRALVGKHQHYRRLFGGFRAMVYEWDACSDSLSGMSSAVTSYWSYPKKVFKWYKSAEIHTKQTFKVPKWVFIPVLGAVMLAIFAPKAYSIIYGGGVKHTATASASVLAPTPSGNPSGAQGGALAPTEHPLNGFPSLASASAVDASQANEQDLAEERQPDELRISPGVYGDDPKQAAHFTQDELRRQAAAVAVLDRAANQGRYVPVSEPVQHVDLHVTYVNPVEMKREALASTWH